MTFTQESKGKEVPVDTAAQLLRPTISHLRRFPRGKYLALPIWAVTLESFTVRRPRVHGKRRMISRLFPGRQFVPTIQTGLLFLPKTSGLSLDPVERKHSQKVESPSLDYLANFYPGHLFHPQWRLRASSGTALPKSGQKPLGGRKLWHKRARCLSPYLKSMEF